MVGKELLEALYSIAEKKDKEEDVLALINAMALIFISLPVSLWVQPQAPYLAPFMM